MNIYGEEYQRCQEFSRQFEESEIGQHYKNNFCLEEASRPMTSSMVEGAYSKIQPYIVNTLDEVRSKVRRQLCVLPKGHVGRCSCLPKMFISSALTKKIDGKTKTSILNTPGADDYVFKNRCTRLFPIALTNEQERIIRQPQGEKLKCAIPLKEQTTPFMMATALIDWVVYTTSVNGIDVHINPHSYDVVTYNTNGDKLNEHKYFLKQYFISHNRRIFNDMGHTICPVIHKDLEIINVSDPERDNRTDIDRYDVQMGHISSRTNECYTIYGTNLVMMTREGNRIIGEYSLIQDDWINYLRALVAHFD
tara:strand:+ start:965 stop:1885 length:921 start_codon:yes stop_codon:yes gene_type:complete